MLNDLLGLDFIDLGLSKPLRAPSSGLCGTINFAPPEVLLGYKYWPALLDIFTLGVTIFMIVFRKYPFNVNDNMRDPY